MGRCPPDLMDIAEGTRRLLPMVRACVQVTVLQPATADRTQRQKGMIGNTIFVPQATPSQFCKVLPPPMEDVQEHLTFVLVDHEKRNLSTAPLLRAPRAEYEAAVRSLQERSLYYKDVEVRVERLLSEDGDPILLDCVLETDPRERSGATTITDGTCRRTGTRCWGIGGGRVTRWTACGGGRRHLGRLLMLR